MGGATSFISSMLTAITVILVLGLAYLAYSSYTSNWYNPISAFLGNLGTNQTGQVPITTISQHGNTSQTNAQLDAYALNLINTDRHQFGLQNVTLSNETSGQQHAQNMLANYYFSHWDIYGMKPYMRYTLVGGNGAVAENVAYRYSASCLFSVCSGNVNVPVALKQMEYSMMYNDSACCNNGHRDDILDPHHNQVSIGIAYNSSSAYFVEDFVNNYISWNNFGVNQATAEMYLSGAAQTGYNLASVLVTYDAPVVNMTRVQLDNTSSYSFGKQVAGVASNPAYYYPGLTTILADQYTTNGRSFSVAFNLKSLIAKFGPGEYTVLIWLNDTTGSSFIASTYTIFVGNGNTIYLPSKI